LYYRLNGLTVQLPALRERTDFAALTAQLLADLATEQGLPHPVQVAPDLLQRLAAHPWPGNLRQYASVLRTACAMLAEGEDTLGWEHLGDDIVQALQTAAPPLSARLPGLTTRQAGACGSGAQPARALQRRHRPGAAKRARQCLAGGTPAGHQPPDAVPQAGCAGALICY
jgi:transcriptional regulator of acetoin/glycerol metabolism